MTDSDSLDTRQQLGLLFRQARETQNLEISDVSAELKLLAASVRGLESADYRAIKGSVFVKGYIKAYAQFLQLDQDECLRLYAEGDVPLSDVAPVSREDKTPSTSLLIKIAAGFIVFVVILLCYQLFGDSAESESAGRVIPITPSDEADKTKVLTDMPDAFQSEVQVAELEVGVVSSQRDLNDVVEASNDVILNAVDITSVDPVRMLSLIFNDDCWVEVTDATGKELLSDLKRAGEKIVLNGEPPFEALFGYGPAVAVSYLGERVDFTVGENPTVKLTVGEKQ